MPDAKALTNAAPPMQPGHDAEASRVFFDQWHVYDQIVRADYMQHRSIHAAIRRMLEHEWTSPFSVLDLGCGDASHIAQTLHGLPVRAYTGVDVSPVALAEAREHLGALSCAVMLVEADFMTYLAEATTPRAEVVVAGFAVHHLTSEEKPVFFRACFERLTAPGDLLLYDIFRRPEESRAQYLAAYFANCDAHWREISAAHLARTKQHARDCDFPETYADLAAMAEAVGFEVPSALVSAEDGFHGLAHFRKRDHAAGPGT